MIDREEKHGGRVAFADYQTMETAFAKEELGPQDLKMGEPPHPWLSPSLPLWLLPSLPKELKTKIYSHTYSLILPICLTPASASYQL